MVTRRDFVKLAGAAPFLTAPPFGFRETEQTSSNHPRGPEIRRISIFNSSGSFYRFIGPNAYDERPKGITGTRRSCLVELSDRSVGIGTVGYSRLDDDVLGQIRQLIGKEIFSFYRWNEDRITGVSREARPYFFDAQYAWIESGILDAIGKQKQLPVWKLMGEPVRDGVDPYDGTMYFEDIARDTGVTVIAEIGKRIKADGYRAIKIKLGRPDKWLPGEAGLHRDIEAFIALREAVGSNFSLMADANNGYRDKFDWAVTLLKSCAPYSMYFMEELFPDDTASYVRLRDRLLEEGLYVAIAEGEGIRDMNAFDSYLRDGIYNYIQPDMPTCGFSNILDVTKKTVRYPQAKLIPHVWQSQMGLVMSLHASKVHWNIPFVEDSRYDEHVFDCSGYVFRGGQWFIPDKPGWGVSLNPDYQQFVVDAETVIS